jgi:hypothetical protein
MFWLEDGLASSLRPGSRPRTTLSPSLALRDGRPYLAFGTPGGDMQDQWSLHFFLNLVHSERNLQQAIDAPDFHSLHVASSFYPRQAEPGRLVIEDRFPATTIDACSVGTTSKSSALVAGRTTAVARDGVARPRPARAAHSPTPWGAAPLELAVGHPDWRVAGTSSAGVGNERRLRSAATRSGLHLLHPWKCETGVPCGRSPGVRDPSPADLAGYLAQVTARSSIDGLPQNQYPL